ncbi:3-methyl-2-oxobutanoate hydroxymethyltransferase [Sphaerotilus sp.]|uniref:3-methyl-2-oxobutanoate hydroxymethyltransferase n=1 Tax=Sphaerotilus sp. TaxID=2093942 RepID=UPI0034E2E8B0
MKKPQRSTIADLRALKGQRQLSMLRVETLDEAAAAQQAGVDLVSVPPGLLGPAFREAAPTLFAVPGLEYGDFVSAEEYLRAAFAAMKAGGDAVYCAASMGIVRRLRDEGIPVCGHTGLIPSQCTWTGGFKAVGKTLETAQLVYRQVKALEEAGAFAAEIEVVPADIAAAISKRTSLLLISMGAGAGGDAQYLFASDVLGANTGHIPRHAKVYRHFAVEYARLQAERIAAFTEYRQDVVSGAYPQARHNVSVAPEVLDQFTQFLDQQP